MDDPTDTALGVCTGLGIFFCCVAGLWSAWRNNHGRPHAPAGMKQSPSMENLTDSASESNDPANNV